MKKDTKQFIAEKFAKKWVEENKEMLADYQEICHKLLMFRAMWGIEIGFVFKNTEEMAPKLGEGYAPAGITEELFDAQKTTNNIEKYAKNKFSTSPLKKAQGIQRTTETVRLSKGRLRKAARSIRKDMKPLEKEENVKQLRYNQSVL